MSARVTVAVQDGQSFVIDVDDIDISLPQRLREVPCPDSPPCLAVHRKPVGRTALRIRGTNARFVEGI